MRTVHNTPTHLVIEDRPWLIAGALWVAGIVAVFAGLSGQMSSPTEAGLALSMGFAILAVVWRFIPYQRLTFDRTGDRFTRRVARVTGVTTETLSLRDIRRAAAQSDWGDSGRSERLVLVTQSGAVPLEFGFVGIPRTSLIDTINAWLAERA